ncbi:DoxX family protein [Nocardia sp. XZ_19_231]|uniref:DoxX family protein n=1 Tax=Nocardia sp. XZ_19_231 TaxID=2769252 RepID=UPI00188FC8E4|nr:DoxX family protein [Nocardia sp. XZ_19_231]
MNVFLWILQGLVAVVVVAAGAGKLAQPRAKLTETMGWAESFSDAQVKAIGAVEIMGGLGLVLPALTGVAPVLTPLAAAGIALVMLGAVITHVLRGEKTEIIPGAVLFVLVAVIAWGRFGPYAF